MAELNRRGRPVEDFLERVGQGRTPLTDAYAYLMRASWWNVVGLAFVAYALGNLFFALLYWLVPGCIANSDGSFADAFFFSVQTSATIGYGGLSPVGAYGNAVVFAEAFVSLIGTAVLTGLVFAKFARPRARVLFSKPILIELRDGTPTLTFRCANERGNDVVEAAIRVSVLKTSLTKEGKRMRRFYDLELARDRSPIFVLSWQVFHAIDERSPLHGLTRAQMIEDDVRFIVSLIAFDGTFSQTIHARHGYYAEDLLVGHRFADVIENRPDGVSRLDFGKFHDTVRDAEHPLAELA